MRPGLPTIEVVVEVLEDLGSDAHVFFTVDAPRVDTEELRQTLEGEDASLLAGDLAAFHARVDPRTAAATGAPLRLAVDPARFHFFDSASGENLALRQERSEHQQEVRAPHTSAQTSAS